MLQFYFLNQGKLVERMPFDNKQWLFSIDSTRIFSESVKLLAQLQLSFWASGQINAWVWTRKGP